ncbi:MAG: hypothetical protein RL760_1037 [Candidatus Eisenbacteria bacterium]
MKPHKDIRLILAALLTAGLALTSCAVDGGAELADDVPPPRRSVEAARLGLAPALRPFYDELAQYGDWVLAEPRGWVFRPRVNSVAWRPYQDGHWEPSYTFGWVWESNDPFGWITDHYGFWFHDSFQGWVWQPQGAWAPAWVAWVQVGDFVGWAPLGPDDQTEYDRVPGGVFTYVPARNLAQASSASRASFVNNVPADQGEVRPIESVTAYRGVYWNAGPDLNRVIGTAAADRLKFQERDGAGFNLAPKNGPSADPRDFDRPQLERNTRNLWRVAQRELTLARGGVRGGAQPGGSGSTPPPPPASDRPTIKPAPSRTPGDLDSTRTPAADSLLRARKGDRVPGARPNRP